MKMDTKNAGYAIVASGSDWSGRYGRRPNPKLKGGRPPSGHNPDAPSSDRIDSRRRPAGGGEGRARWTH
jgi:hypothetical protein